MYFAPVEEIFEDNFQSAVQKKDETAVKQISDHDSQLTEKDSPEEDEKIGVGEGIDGAALSDEDIEITPKVDHKAADFDMTEEVFQKVNSK